MTGRPHLWVPYGQEYGMGDAEICTLCGDFSTPESRAADCPEILPDELAPLPAELPALEAAEGADGEMQQGVTKP
jgi:hypothetical protein